MALCLRRRKSEATLNCMPQQLRRLLSAQECPIVNPWEYPIDLTSRGYAWWQDNLSYYVNLGVQGYKRQEDFVIGVYLRRFEWEFKMAPPNEPCTSIINICFTKFTPSSCQSLVDFVGSFSHHRRSNSWRHHLA